MSLANTVDITTKRPSVVDKAAARITTPMRAATNAGNPHATYSSKAWSGTSRSGRATRAYNPPNNTSRQVAAAKIYVNSIFLKSPGFFKESTLLNSCGWDEKANCTINRPKTADTP